MGKHCTKLLYTAFFDTANARKADEHFGKNHDRKAFKALIQTEGSEFSLTLLLCPAV